MNDKNFKFYDEVFVEPHDDIDSVRHKYIELLKSRGINVSEYQITILENFEVVVRLDKYKQLVFQDFLKYTNGCYIKKNANGLSVYGQICGIVGYMPTAGTGGYTYIVKILQSNEFLKNSLKIGDYEYTHIIVLQQYTKILTDEELLQFRSTLENCL
jgi:hypothetical protein